MYHDFESRGHHRFLLATGAAIRAADQPPAEGTKAPEFTLEHPGRKYRQPERFSRQVGRPLFLPERYDRGLHHRSAQFPARSGAV